MKKKAVTRQVRSRYLKAGRKMRPLTVEGADGEGVMDLRDSASPESGRITVEGTLALPEGYYRIAFDLYHAEGFFSRSDIAHIYAGMTTETGGYSLTSDAPAAAAEGTSLEDVLSAINGEEAGENKTAASSPPTMKPCLRQGPPIQRVL
jgi:hypothetical protein